MPKTAILKEDRSQSLERRHPWVFSRAIESLQGLCSGDIVDVLDHKGKFMARGYYEDESIAVRILTFDRNEEIDNSFWIRRLTSALELRKKLGLITPKGAYRLINGEGDDLPGLVIEVYDNVVVIEAYTVAIHRYRSDILSALLEIYEGTIKAVYYSAPESASDSTGDLSLVNQLLLGKYEDVEELISIENGISIYPNILHGKKSEYSLDQRSNREHVGMHAKGKKVLNMFCRSGGFSLAALFGGATMVTSLDSSSKTINLLEQNISLNFAREDVKERHVSVVEDSFKYLQEMTCGKFDMIILDPPAFAKRKNVLRNALQGYRKLNSEAIRKVAPGGWVYTFSSSQAVSVELFKQNIFTSALMAGRNVKIMSQFTQASDYPISIYHPEGEYLKGLLLYVE